MRLEAKHQTALDALDGVLQSAQEPSLGLLTKIVTGGGCTRIPLLAKAGLVDQLIEFAKIGAWTEAAFALIALELPLWRVRRLVYEDGEWLCSLSHQPNFAMPCRSPSRAFLTSSHGRSKSSAVRITGDDWKSLQISLGHKTKIS
jgi:hypothetical protein